MFKQKQGTLDTYVGSQKKKRKRIDSSEDEDGDRSEDYNPLNSKKRVKKLPKSSSNTKTKKPSKIGTLKTVIVSDIQHDGEQNVASKAEDCSLFKKPVTMEMTEPKKPLVVAGTMDVNVDTHPDSIILSKHPMFLKPDEKKRRAELMKQIAMDKFREENKKLDKEFFSKDSKEHPLMTEEARKKRKEAQKLANAEDKCANTKPQDDYIDWEHVKPMENLPSNVEWSCDLQMTHNQITFMEDLPDLEEMLVHSNPTEAVDESVPRWSDFTTRKTKITTRKELSPESHKEPLQNVGKIIKECFAQKIPNADPSLADICQSFLTSFKNRNAKYDQSALFSTLYRPLTERQFVGGFKQTRSIEQLSLWLSFMRDKLNGKSSDVPQLTDAKTLVILSGPVGCGKTSCVHALADEIGFEILHITPLSDRFEELKDKTEATQSQLLNISGKKQLVFIDEIDQMYCDNEKDYRSFLNGVRILLGSTKIPVIATCDSFTDEMANFFNASNSLVLEMADDDDDLLIQKRLALLFAVGINNGVVMDVDQLLSLLITYKQDIRKCLSLMQFCLESCSKQYKLAEYALGVDWIYTKNDDDQSNANNVWQDQHNMLFNNYITDDGNLDDVMTCIESLSEMDTVMREHDDEISSTHEMLLWKVLPKGTSLIPTTRNPKSININPPTITLTNNIQVSNPTFYETQQHHEKELRRLTRKARSSKLSPYDVDVSQTIATICRLESERKEVTKARRFYHTVHELDKEEIKFFSSFDL
jgi:nucleoside-triphosphatase THEP1